jgi:MtN3 and saliva related transmembrane protein
MTAIITDLVGYTAVVVGTSLMLPQVVKSFRTKKMSDVSFGTIVLYFFNCLLWLIYSWMIRAWPPVVANAIGLAISVPTDPAQNAVRMMGGAVVQLQHPDQSEEASLGFNFVSIAQT